jgi:transposase-like protein
MALEPEPARLLEVNRKLLDGVSAHNEQHRLAELVARGLSGAQLLIRDEHAGLIAAARKVLSEGRQQRCTVHLMRNAFTRVPQRHPEAPRPRVRRRAARGLARRGEAQPQALPPPVDKQFPEAVACLESAFADAPSYFAFPQAHWMRILSTSGLERLHGEITRRTRAIGAFRRPRERAPPDHRGPPGCEVAPP